MYHLTIAHLILNNLRVDSFELINYYFFLFYSYFYIFLRVYRCINLYGSFGLAPALSGYLKLLLYFVWLSKMSKIFSKMLRRFNLSHKVDETDSSLKWSEGNLSVCWEDKVPSFCGTTFVWYNIKALVPLSQGVAPRIRADRTIYETRLLTQRFILSFFPLAK